VSPADRSVLAHQQRRLRHVCLAYLGSLGESSIELAAKHYANSGNMTEQVAALAVLADHEGSLRDDAFANFYQHFQGDDLVIDKWFSLQARADCADCVEQISALREHDDFKLHNPNRVRSLLSSFAMGNHAHFHRADGGGYCLIGDAVLALSVQNPQLAARLVSTLNQWKRYDSSRQSLMRAQLQRIKDSKPSRDVLEIVDKALKS
jgi:aminopeptidase N